MIINMLHYYFKVEDKAADSEGELMIDEGSSSPTLPPVLTREISKTDAPEVRNM